MGLFGAIKKIAKYLDDPVCICECSCIAPDEALKVCDYVAFDVETSGLDPVHDRIIEVAAVKCKNDQIVDRFDALVFPGTLVSAEITKITGITNEDLRGKARFADIAAKLTDFIGDLPIVAHNADFDAQFLVSELKRANRSFSFRYIDTLALARQMFPTLKNHKLNNLSKALRLADKEQSHRASGDAELCQKLFVFCKEEKISPHKIDVSAEPAAAKKNTNISRYTAPAELDKAVSTLVGIIYGIKADGVITENEAVELAHWIAIHGSLRSRPPFKELIPPVEAALSDGVITQEECEDILWLCERIAQGGEYYNGVTPFLQQLSGLIHGMLADGKLDDNEIQSLKVWVESNDFLSDFYPFDEIKKRLEAILADGLISKEEREELIAFLSNFVDFKSSYNLSEKEFAALRERYTTAGICTPCPDMCLENMAVCFTGDSYKTSYDGLCQAAESKGAIVRQNVSGKTDYLIVGDAGSRAWAFSCYGRKVEKAMQLQKEGRKVQIVNETDFWHAVEK